MFNRTRLREIRPGNKPNTIRNTCCIQGSRHVQSAIYTVVHEESESEVQNVQILQENLKDSISISSCLSCNPIRGLYPTARPPPVPPDSPRYPPGPRKPIYIYNIKQCTISTYKPSYRERFPRIWMKLRGNSSYKPPGASYTALGP